MSHWRSTLAKSAETLTCDLIRSINTLFLRFGFSASLSEKKMDSWGGGREQWIAYNAPDPIAWVSIPCFSRFLEGKIDIGAEEREPQNQRLYNLDRTHPVLAIGRLAVQIRKENEQLSVIGIHCLTPWLTHPLQLTSPYIFPSHICCVYVCIYLGTVHLCPCSH